jgi:4-amino-4-deoxy-L-arabinose transferase-like glycosyltransferase
VPLTLLALLITLGREPTPGRAALAGLVVGVGILTRPSTFFVFAGILVAWIIAAGWRRGLAQTVLAVTIAAVVVMPWTIRNAVVTDGFVPISVQDGALAGTFNPDSANDPVYPYAWRPNAPAIAELFDPRHPLGDADLRRQLIDRGLNYIGDHPESVPAAFFWNGLSRLWDVRRPSRALNEVAFEGRSRTVTKVGLGMYYVLLPLALAGLWLARRRRELFWPLVALALAASVVFTVDSGTRYRAPLEPIIAILACAAAAALADRIRGRSAPGPRPGGSPLRP